MLQNDSAETEVVTLGSRRRLTIPRKLLEPLGLRAGDRIEVAVDGPGLRLTRAPDDAELLEALDDSAAGRVRGPFDSVNEVLAALELSSF